MFVKASLGGKPIQLGQSARELVAGALQLLEVGDPGPAHGPSGGAGRDEREALGDDPREL